MTHPFLRRFAAGGLARWQLWGYASQHYHLVCFFTAYPEAIASRTPDAEVRRLLRDILEDEYMRPQSFARSHPALYRRFLRAVGFGEGEWNQVLLLPATRAFVQLHLDMTLRSWLEALGAVGPGHEWAIPLMFPHLAAGIEQSLLLDPAALEYFQLHITLDVEHGKALEESLLRWATTDQHQEEIRRGAQRSLTLGRHSGAPYRSSCLRIFPRHPQSVGTRPASRCARATLTGRGGKKTYYRCSMRRAALPVSLTPRSCKQQATPGWTRNHGTCR